MSAASIISTLFGGGKAMLTGGPTKAPFLQDEFNNARAQASTAETKELEAQMFDHKNEQKIANDLRQMDVEQINSISKTTQAIQY